MDNSDESIKRIEESQEVLKAIIGDLISAYNELDDFLNIVKDPVRLAFTLNLNEELNSKVNKARIHFLMAANKIEAYNKYSEDHYDKGEGE